MALSCAAVCAQQQPENTPADPAARAGPATATTAPSATATEPTGLARWLDPSTAPFLPVPELDTSPYSGFTYGLIPVVLSTDAQGNIDRIVAPDVIRSQYFGWGARWRVFRNPSDDERWSVVGGAKQHTESEFDAEYDEGLRRTDPWTWAGRLIYDRSGTGRFFGIGNDTHQSDATTYVDSQGRAELTAARNFSQRVQLAYTARLDAVTISHGVLTLLPSIETRYPGLIGIGAEHELQQRLVLTYDTRATPMIPRQGERVAVFAGFSQRDLASTTSYSFIGVDASLFRPLGPGVTLAAHLALRYMPNYADAPFWALSSVGGDRSVVGETQPLRAFGDQRFVDRDSFAGNLEFRLHALALHLFATDLSVEPAPFLDAGKVYARNSDSPFTHDHLGAGLGFRVVAAPYVVGYLDLGFGRNGVAVFSGINYPF